MAYHVESDSGLHADIWEGSGGKGVYLRKERRRRAPLYRELGRRLGLAVKGMSLISSD